VIGHLQRMRSEAPGNAALSEAPPKAASRQVDSPAPASKLESLPVTAPKAFGTETPPLASDSSDALEPLWKNLVDAVGRASAFTRSYLTEARPVSLSRDVLTIGFDPEFADQMELVNNNKTHSLLQTKLKELGHPNAQIKFVKAERMIPRAVPKDEEPAPERLRAEATASVEGQPATKTGEAKEPAGRREKPASVAINADEFKNDPLIQEALEVFKGQIVEVRV